MLIYSGHGGNAAPLTSIVADLQRGTSRMERDRLHELGGLDDALFPVAEAFGVSKFAAGWHAAELETSMILAMKPELVLMDRAALDFMGDLHQKRDILMAEGVQAIAPTGVLGDPTIATAAHGERYLDALTESVAGFFKDELRKRRA